MRALSSAAAIIVAVVATALAATAPAATAAEDAVLPPKVAGARYGQALGASLICAGTKLTPAADALLARYSGADLDTFKAQAQSVTLLWKKTLGCDPKADINRCRLLNEMSYTEALKEIGPAGSQLPGLIVKAE